MRNLKPFILVFLFIALSSVLESLSQLPVDTTLLMKKIVTTYDESNSEWMDFQETDFSYDSWGYITERLTTRKGVNYLQDIIDWYANYSQQFTQYKRWNEEGFWENLNWEIINFNENGDVDYIEIRNQVDSEWITTRKTIYHHDNENRNWKIEFQSIDNGKLITTGEWEVIQFHSSGSIAEVIQKILVDDEMQPRSKYNYFYDDKNRDTLIIHSRFVDEWYQGSKTQKIYDEDNHTMTTNYYYKDGENWKLDNTLFARFDDGNLISEEYTITNAVDEFVKYTLTEYTYTESGLIEEEILHLYSDDEWIPRTKTEYIYEDVILSIRDNEIESPIIKVAPEPAVDVHFIEISSMNDKILSAEIFDMTGRKVGDISEQYRNANGKISISLEPYDSGTYFYKFTTKNGEYSKKFIIYK